MKRVLRKIVFICSVLVMGTAIFIFATTIFAMKTFYSNDYLLDIIGLTPKASYQTAANQRWNGGHQMMASDAAKSMEPDISKTKAWKIGLFVILIIFTLFITGTSILNSQSEKQGHFKMEQVAFEIYTKYSQQLDTISGKNWFSHDSAILKWPSLKLLDTDQIVYHLIRVCAARTPSENSSIVIDTKFGV